MVQMLPTVSARPQYVPHEKATLWSLYQLAGMCRVRGLYPGSTGRLPAVSLMRAGSRKGKRSPERAAKRSASSASGVARHPGVLAAADDANVPDLDVQNEAYIFNLAPQSVLMRFCPHQK